jgi:hypothetical protein
MNDVGFIYENEYGSKIIYIGKNDQSEEFYVNLYLMRVENTLMITHIDLQMCVIFSNVKY